MNPDPNLIPIRPMPIVDSSTFEPPRLLRNGHLQTIYPNFFRRVNGVTYQRERIATQDDDFLDLDWSRVGAGRVAIISHGLEGDSGRPYVLGMVRALNGHGWDALAWNCRGCSGEPNRKLSSYHSGASGDLQVVVDHAAGARGYGQIALIGFSLGGNMTLKYLGERGQDLPAAVRGAAAFSVPCDLKASSEKMAGAEGRVYMIRFLRKLRKKLEAKKQLFPGEISTEGYNKLKTFRDFDDRYTAPLHGFRDAEDYWQQSSGQQFITHIAVPTLLTNARNDPFLAGGCYPVEEAKANPNFFLEMPESGGHVGFVRFDQDGLYWSEERAVGFLGEL